MLLATSVVSAWETHAASLWRTGWVCQLSMSDGTWEQLGIPGLTILTILPFR